MDYGHAALDLLMLARLAEYELAINRTRWLREYHSIEDRERAARRSQAARPLAAPRPRATRSTITRTVRRVAGSLRAFAATD